MIAGGSGLALFDHVEVVVERRHFVDLGHRHLQFTRERNEMPRLQAAVAVLDLVQVLDQQIAAAWRIAEQRAHLLARRRVNAPPLRRRADLPARVLFGERQDR